MCMPARGWFLPAQSLPATFLVFKLTDSDVDDSDLNVERRIARADHDDVIGDWLERRGQESKQESRADKATTAR